MSAQGIFSLWRMEDVSRGWGPRWESVPLLENLAERLARRFDWGVTIRAVEPHGTRVRLTWPSLRPAAAHPSIDAR